MFDDFEPMGGEKAPEEGGDEFGEFGEMDDLVDKAMQPEDEGKSSDEIGAELEVGKNEMDEFPNIGADEPEEDEKVPKK